MRLIDGRVHRWWISDVKVGTRSVWNHATNVSALLDAIYCRGEICVTSFPKPIFGEDHQPPEAVIAFRGQASYHFPVDCWSTIMPDGLRETGSYGGYTSYDEAWIVPAKCRVLGIYVDPECAAFIPNLGSMRVEIFHNLSEFKKRGYMGMPIGHGCRYGTLADRWPNK